MFAKNFARNYEKKNNTWNIRCLVDESFVTAIQRIILKIVGFYIIFIGCFSTSLVEILQWREESAEFTKFFRKEYQRRFYTAIVFELKQTFVFVLNCFFQSYGRYRAAKHFGFDLTVRDGGMQFQAMRLAPSVFHRVPQILLKNIKFMFNNYPL